MKRIAYATSGSTGHRNDANRSSPRSAWAPLFALPDILWLDTEAWALGDWETTRQRLAAVDMVVTVDTALAHLAGAMGIPTLVLLSADCDARWGMLGANTLWYDSWMLIRQPIAGDWSTVMAVAKEVIHARMLESGATSAA